MEGLPEPGRDLRASVPQIRRTRLHPRRTDELYLHLVHLRDDLRREIARLAPGDVLDLYCGARPYEPLYPPGTRTVGLDVDDAYGCADVVSTELLPFPDASFDLCICTQAFYFVPEPARAVAAIERVLRPGGHVLLTQPLAYPGTQRLYTPLQLTELFAGWQDIVVVENGGTVASVVTLVATLLHDLEKRTPWPLRRAFALAYLVLNTLGGVADRAEERLRSPGSTAFAPNFLFSARRPSA